MQPSIAPETRWYYARDRKKIGPVGREELQTLAAQGELRPSDMVLREGQTKWVPAQEVAELVWSSPSSVAPPTLNATVSSGPAPETRPSPWSPGLTTIPYLPAGCTNVPSLPGYEMLGELGRGGMGVVYKARQTSLKRLVALKMILAGGHAGPSLLARFRREAEAVARLQHPNIVQVHETGEIVPEGGGTALPYFSLEFVDGGSLDGYLAGTPQAPEQSARLVRTLARAMHAAHQANIVHRDLKPANVLLAFSRELPAGTSSGKDVPAGGPRLDEATPKITDFGLAKQLDADSGQTHSGAIMGTPSYMAPEQAAGRIKEIGPAADVWALGAILYQCLTGRPPFKAANVAGTLEQVLHQEPVAPSRLQPSTPRDLETVCLKCLEKEPRRRYPSAEALARDLEHYLDGKPTDARPVGSRERLWKWAKRKPMVASLGAAVIVVFLAGFGLTLWQLTEKEQARQTAVKNKNEADEENTAKTVALGLRDEAVKKRDVALGARDAGLYIANMNLVQRHWERGDVESALRLLKDFRPKAGEPDRREFEWHYYWRLCHAAQHILPKLPEAVRSAAFAPNSERLAIACHDGSVLLWDTDSRKAPALLAKEKAPVRAVAFSPDGRTLAWATAAPGMAGLLKLWDVARGKVRAVLRGHRLPVTAFAFSPDSTTLGSTAAPIRIAGSGDPGESYHFEVDTRKTVGELKLWDVAAGKEKPGAPAVASGALSVCFTADGKELFAGMADGTVKTWTFPEGKETATYKLPFPVWAVVCQPSGKTFVTAGGRWGARGEARLWEKGSARQPHVLQGHFDAVSAATYSPDGTILATASFDHTVRLWDAFTGAEAGTFKGHDQLALAVAFSSDGRTVATGGVDRTLRLWDLAATQEWVTFEATDESFTNMLRWSPDSRTLAVCTARSKWNLRDVRTLKLRSTVKTYQIEFGADSKARAAEGNETATSLVIWDPAQGRDKPVRVLPTGQWDFGYLSANLKYAAVFHPCGDKYARDLSLWNVTGDKRLTAVPRGALAKVTATAFSPDGKRFAFSTQGNVLQVWDVAVGRMLFDTRDKGYIDSLAFSPDGKWLAAGQTGGKVCLLESSTLKRVVEFRGHLENVVAVAFSPDGRLLASGSRGDNRIKLWDLRTVKERLTLTAPSPGVYVLSFSPDGQTLAAALNGKVILYRAPRDETGPRSVERMAPTDWHQARADVASGSEDWFARRFHLDRLVALRPDDAALRRQRGLTFAKQQQWNQAAADFDRAVALNKEDAQLWFFRGVMRSNLKRWELALGDLTHAIELAPRNSAFWLLRSVAESHLGRADAAEQSLNRATEAYWFESPVLNDWRMVESVLEDGLAHDNTGGWRWRGRGLCRMVRATLVNTEHRSTEVKVLREKALADINEALRLQADDRGALVVRGMLSFDLNQFEKARDDLTRAIDLGCRSGLVFGIRGTVLAKLGQLDRGLADLARAVELGKDRALLWRWRGAALKTAGRLKEALADYDKALSIDAGNVELWRDRALVHAEREDWPRALADLERAMSLKPDDAETWRVRGNLHGHLNRWDQAEADFSRAIELNRTHWVAWGNRGVAHIRGKQWNRAIADLTRAIELAPQQPDAWRHRGAAHATLKKWAAAEADFSRVIELRPGDAECWTNRSIVRLHLQQYDKALADVNEALRLNPGNGSALFQRASVYYRRQEYGRAVTDFSAVLEKEPRNVRAWNSRGDCLTHLKLWTRAAADYTKALALTPDDLRLLGARGFVYLQAGKPQEAARDCTRYLERNQKETVVWLTRAMARAELGEWDSAAADFTHGLKQPEAADESPSVRMKSWEEFAAVSLKRKDNAGYRAACRKLLDLHVLPGEKYPPAGAVWICSMTPLDGIDRARPLALAEKLAAARPKHPAALFIYGAALLRAGKFSEAAVQLHKATDLSRQAPTVWYLLAITHARQGQPEEARRWLTRATEWHDQASKQKRGDPVPKGTIDWHRLPWTERFGLQLLREEAEALLRK